MVVGSPIICHGPSHFLHYSLTTYLPSHPYLPILFSPSHSLLSPSLLTLPLISLFSSPSLSHLTSSVSPHPHSHTSHPPSHRHSPTYLPLLLTLTLPLISLPFPPSLPLISLSSSPSPSHLAPSPLQRDQEPPSTRSWRPTGRWRPIAPCSGCPVTSSWTATRTASCTHPPPNPTSWEGYSCLEGTSVLAVRSVGGGVWTPVYQG